MRFHFHFKLVEISRIKFLDSRLLSWFLSNSRITGTRLILEWNKFKVKCMGYASVTSHELSLIMILGSSKKPWQKINGKDKKLILWLCTQCIISRCSKTRCSNGKKFMTLCFIFSRNWTNRNWFKDENSGPIRSC